MPLERLVARMMRELERQDAVFDLPLGKAFLGSAAHDFGVRFHGRRAASPFGPAAGPHAQMAQNVALAWLGGARVIELKTVQIDDRLAIPRPCIDMRTVGYNVEWSQELRLEESAEEYVKGAMLVEMLRASLGERIAPGFHDTIYDMSVGYDLAGIASPRVRRFIETMMDAAPLVERLRGEIPRERRHLRDLDFPRSISTTLTLSTFHGCPPDEIERILEHLMREHGLSVIVKLNPTLLGPDEVEHLLHRMMGYDSVRVPPRAFSSDTTWEQACGFTERLSGLAASLGVGFGVKLTNTLIVDHDGDFLGPAKEKYLSGAPLHVLAMALVARFRERFGAALPISFSAGIDRRNFADAVALGLVPVTVCSDLLREGGYARAAAYFRNLVARMDGAGVASVSALVEDGDGGLVRRSADYAARAAADPRYGQAANRKAPPKIGRHLALFDCITCDKCIPVCPNDANFALRIPPQTVPVVACRRENGAWICERRGEIALARNHQIATFADFCNECGNCDVFCPEDGGPYVVKPRFFGTAAAFDRFPALDGFFVARDSAAVRVRGRFGAVEYALEVARTSRRAAYAGPGFAVTLSLDDPAGTIAGRAGDGVEVDLTYATIMDLVARGALDASGMNYVNAGADQS